MFRFSSICADTAKAWYTYIMKGLSRYEKVERPWGNFERFTTNEISTVKILTVNAGDAFSLQFHKCRDEFWHIVQGSGIVHIEETDTEARVGDQFFIPRNIKHRITGGPEGIKCLEISFGEFDENDIERFEDLYGRT